MATNVRGCLGGTARFEVTVILYQGSALGPLLCNTFMDVIYLRTAQVRVVTN